MQPEGSNLAPNVDFLHTAMFDPYYVPKMSSKCCHLDTRHDIPMSFQLNFFLHINHRKEPCGGLQDLIFFQFCCCRFVSAPLPAPWCLKFRPLLLTVGATEFIIAGGPTELLVVLGLAQFTRIWNTALCHWTSLQFTTSGSNRFTRVTLELRFSATGLLTSHPSGLLSLSTCLWALSPFLCPPICRTESALALCYVSWPIHFLAVTQWYFCGWFKQRAVFVVSELVAWDCSRLGASRSTCDGTLTPVCRSPFIHRWGYFRQTLFFIASLADGMFVIVCLGATALVNGGIVM